MKKILLFATAIALSWGTATAKRSIVPAVKAAAGTVSHNPEAQMQTRKAPAMRKIELEENQMVMGPYTSDALCQSGYGLGVTGVPGELKAAVYLDADQVNPFDGGQIVSFRFGLDAATTVANVFLLGVTESGATESIFTEDFGEAKKGWNELKLKEPVTLDCSMYVGYLMGYQYKQTSSNYPISTVDEGAACSLLIWGNLGQGEGWYDMGSDYGNLSVQAVVESENFQAVNVVLDKLTIGKNYYQAGENVDFSVTLHNFGTGSPESFKLDVALDGDVKGEITGGALGSQTLQTTSSTLELPTDLERGTHLLTVTLVEVDGEALAETKSLEGTFFAYSESVPRQKNLVEQFTSQYCTYCPRGVTFFSDLMEMRDDIAWVSIHGNMSSTDIFNIAACDEIMYYMGVSGFPSAAYNRSYVPDLAEGSEIVYGLGYNMSYRTQVVEMLNQVIDQTAEVPSFVTLALDPIVDSSTRELTFSVSGTGVNDAAEILSGYGLYVLLTENGLVARQLNEGRWVQNYTHHYVFRNMFTNTTGDAIEWSGNDFSRDFTYTVPEDFNLENLQVVAFVAPLVDFNSPDVMNMAVNNCEKADVSVNNPSGIADVENGKSATQTRYSLDGRLLRVPQKGVNIVRMADGRVVKTIEK